MQAPSSIFWDDMMSPISLKLFDIASKSRGWLLDSLKNILKSKRVSTILIFKIVIGSKSSSLSVLLILKTLAIFYNI